MEGRMGGNGWGWSVGGRGLRGGKERKKPYWGEGRQRRGWDGMGGSAGGENGVGRGEGKRKDGRQCSAVQS